MIFKKTQILVAGFTLAMICGVAVSAELKWSSYPYSLYAKQDGLRDILTGIASSEGIPIEVSDAVEDVISANFENMTRGQIFKQLVEAYGLAWYYDGHRLYVDLLENTKASTIKLRSISVAAFKQHLEKLGVIDDDYKYGWQAIEHKKLIYISGPVPFVQRVQHMAKVLDDRNQATETIYKWTDASGVTHYSSDPVEAPKSARVIEVQSGDSMTVLSSADTEAEPVEAPLELSKPTAQIQKADDDQVIFNASSYQ